MGQGGQILGREGGLILGQPRGVEGGDVSRGG
jgi:hypothetical protein